MEKDALISSKPQPAPVTNGYNGRLSGNECYNSLSASMPSGVECISVYPGRLRSKSLSYASPDLYNSGEIGKMRDKFLRSKRKRRFSRTQTVYLILIYSATFMSYCCLSIMAPFYPPEASKKGMSDTTAGLVFSFYAFIMFITSPMFGIIIPKFGARPIFLMGHTLSAVCNIAFGTIHYIDDYTLFTTLSFLMRGAEGFGASAAVNAEFVMLSTHFPDDGGYVRGLFETFVGLGLGTGPAIGGLLFAIGGFGLSFYVIGGLILLIVLLSIYLLPQAAESSHVVEKKKKGSLFSLMKLPQVLVCCFTILVISIIWAVLGPTLEPHLRKFEFSPVILGLMFLIPSALYGVCSPFWGWMTDRLGAYWWLMTVGLLMSSLSYLFLGPSSFVTFFISDSIPLNIIALAGIGIFSAMDLMPTYQAILDGALENGYGNDENTHSLVTSLWMSTYSLGDVLGPVIGGVILDHYGFSAVSAIGVILNISMALISFAYFMTKRKPKSLIETNSAEEQKCLNADISIIKETEIA